MVGTPTQHHPLLAVDQVLQRLETIIAPRFVSDTAYDLVSLPMPDFCRGMEEIGIAGPRRFLEVGCGIGSKLAAAFFLGWGDLTGVELRPEYADLARKVCPEAEIICADAFDFDGYGDFDVIYQYRPFIEDMDQDRLETHILARAKPGTVMFWPQRGGIWTV